MTLSLCLKALELTSLPINLENPFDFDLGVENLVQNLSESADLSDSESECDVPINDDSPESHFTTFSNPLFNSNDDFSSDDESLSEEEIQNDEFKYFSNPLYDLDDEINPNQKDLDVVIPNPPGIDKHCFNAESDLLESLLNRDSPINSTKIDSIFDEFSFPRPPEESNYEYSNLTIESLSPSPIPIDIFLASDDSTPLGVESDYDSEGDILLLEELLNDDLVPLVEYNHFTFDVEPDTAMKNGLDELNEDECFDPGGSENVVFLNVEEDDSFTFTIRTFLPFVTYPENSPLLSSTKNEDPIFDRHLRLEPLALIGMELSCLQSYKGFFMEVHAFRLVFSGGGCQKPLHYPLTVGAREESTDISNLQGENSTIKGKHGHGKRKSTREAKDSKPKPEKVKLQSKKVNPGQTKVNSQRTKPKTVSL
ncbi:hypothetical protein Tco_0057911 [Tanacetum coccineum]